MYRKKERVVPLNVNFHHFIERASSVDVAFERHGQEMRLL